MIKYTAIVAAILLCTVSACSTSGGKIENIHYVVEDGDSIRAVTDSNGNIIERGQFKNGNYHGFYQKYYSNGNTKMQGAVADGKKTGAWKFFDDKANLIRVEQYENDSVVITLDKDDFLLDTVTVQDFSILCPKKWERSTENGRVLLQVRKKCTEVFCPNFTVVRDTLPELAFADYVDFSLSKFNSKLAPITIINKYETTIFGNQSVICEYSILTNNVHLFAITGWILKGNKVLIISAMSYGETEKDILMYRSLFASIIFSLKIK